MRSDESVRYGSNLTGKSALITGGAGGIGRAIALLFASEGAAVAVMDTNAAGGQQTVNEIEAKNGKALLISGDVSNAGDCRKAVKKTADAFGSLDILVNNAGIIRRATVLDLSESDWDTVMAVNVRSVFLLSKYSIPLMAAKGGGVIVNIASGWGLVGGGKAVSYCASKGAVVQMTRALAIDHGGQNIRVNCVCPGDTDTSMLRSEASQIGQEERVFLEEAADRPLGRIGRPEDIAQAVLYLASGASSFVTGAALVVDGGGLAG
ncbi:SDR family NAD(P)-dependent oxidoreductase [candidate division KSB1 bacterium]